MTPFGSDAHRLLRAVRRVVVLMIATITLMSSPMVSMMRKRCDLLALAPPALATITFLPTAAIHQLTSITACAGQCLPREPDVAA